jgi:hypothetical protein
VQVDALTLYLIDAFPKADSVVMHANGRFSATVPHAETIAIDADREVILLDDEDEPLIKKRRRVEASSDDDDRPIVISGPFFQPREVIDLTLDD